MTLEQIQALCEPDDGKSKGNVKHVSPAEAESMGIIPPTESGESLCQILEREQAELIWRRQMDGKLARRTNRERDLC